MKHSLIGKILIIVGLVISLNPYLIIFIGGPIFLIGVLTYWSTKTAKKSKLKWTITPIVIWYPLMIAFFWVEETIGTAMAQKRDYIISEKFKGTIKVVESECGLKPEIKNGRLQFEIPQNGIYLFNGELKSGYINEKIYIKKENGQLVEIESIFRAAKEAEKDTSGIEKIIGIHGGSYGSFGDNKTNFIEKYVETNKVYDDKTKWRMNKKQDEILDSLRTACKLKN